MRDWYQRNPEKVKRYVGRYRQIHREMVLDHYGRECACCGEAHPIFLTIDHVNGDGAEFARNHGSSHRRNLYRWLVTHGFPPGYQTLCWNCNSGRARNGGICPHREVS